MYETLDAKKTKKSFSACVQDLYCTRVTRVPNVCFPGGRETTSNVWTGAWCERSLKQEQARLQTPFVRLLVVVLFTDGTNLDKLSKKNARPTVVSLLNFTLEVLQGDKSKKLLGFFPDLQYTSEQWEDDDFKNEVRKLNFYVLDQLVAVIAQVYQAGGEIFTDSAGVTWHLVPLVAFTATDTKEARALKGTLESASQRVPCNLCVVTKDRCDQFVHPDDLEYRCQQDTVETVDLAFQATRLETCLTFV